MILALILFALAAAVGLIMAVMRFKGRPRPPLGLAIVHGLAAAAGLTTLIVVLAGAPAGASAAIVGLVMMLAAALGGFLLFANHLRDDELPVPLMVIHALVAVTGFLTLLFGAAI